MQFAPAREILLPVDNLSGRCNRGNVSEIDAALARGEAVIFFRRRGVAPQPGVVCATANGGRFSAGAAKAQAPILPAHIGGRNSLLFYSLSMLYKPLAMLLLAREIFANHALQFEIHLGRLHNWQEIETLGGQQQAAAHLRQQVYQLKPARQTGRLRNPSRCAPGAADTPACRARLAGLQAKAQAIARALQAGPRQD